MRVIFLAYLVLGSFLAHSQTITHNTNFFKSIDTETIKADFKFVSVCENKNYLLLSTNNVEVNYENLYKQFDQLKVKPLEKKIDYNNLMFNCGIPDNRESKDIMISAFKTYLLNKYVFSLFMKTAYN